MFSSRAVIRLMSKGVRLLTYNVFLRPPPIKTNDDDYKEERFNEMINIIEDYDVVCFQEMFQTATFRPERIIEAAIKRKFYYWKSCDPPSFFPGPVVDSGLLVLSRYPIISSTFESYNIGILSDSASDKGYIYCKIKAKGDYIHLFVTHLQASYKLEGLEHERELSVKTRLYQFDILLRRIREHMKDNLYTENDLVLLVGDLNVDSNERPYQMTLDSVLKRRPKPSTKAEVHSQLHMIDLIEPPLEDLQFAEFRQVLGLFRKHKVEIVDHAHQRHQGHPITFGDNDKVLTGVEDVTSFQCLDYIFSLRPSDGKQKGESRLRCLTESCKIEQFKYPNTAYGQLSDHYGMSILID